jgi:hypothetical protein
VNEKENKQTTSELTDKQVKALLKKEYPSLLKQDIERLLKTCRSEGWFQKLVESKRLSEDLKTSRPVVVAPNAGGIDKDTTPSTEESQYGEIPEIYPDDPDPESLKSDRERDIKAFESAIKLFLDCRSDRVRHMRASVSLAILKNNLNLSAIAKHFNVTPERVTQIVKDVKRHEISE